MVTIIEVLRRPKQGRTEPFVCRGDDGHVYYVKGRHAGMRSLCCEWVAGSLARALGMTVPEFTMAEVPRKLIEQSERDDIGQLGAGSVFASLAVENAREISWREACRLPQGQVAEVLFFDLLVQNLDRTLSEKGGNPNLLVTHEPVMQGGEETEDLSVQPWTIDFNLAFDPEFTREKFQADHMFASLLTAWPAGFQERMTRSLQFALLAGVPRYFKQLPDEWLYVDGDESLGVHLDQAAVSEVLNLPFADPDAFWNLPTP